MVRVKICGIISLEDALAAARAGADALGFVFAESPRRVTLDQAREIIRRLPPFMISVGVFANESVEEMQEARTYCGLDVLQLHGEETEQTVACLGGKVIKAVRMGGGCRSLVERYPGAVLLLETDDPVKKGGTGKTFDWTMAVEVARRRPVILAGGLRPENVGQAVAMVKPYAVDVSSGVESEVGRKDYVKIERFVRRAKQAL